MKRVSMLISAEIAACILSGFHMREGRLRAFKVTKNPVPEDAANISVDAERHRIRMWFDTESDVECGLIPQVCVVDELDETLPGKYEKIRSALAGMIGCDTKEELDTMETYIRFADVCESDKVSSLNAIAALRETL